MDKLLNKTNEKYQKAANGEGQFFIKSYLVEKPKAVAVILHDLISHGGRYENLALELNKKHINVLLPDIVGLGMSKQGHPGAFAMNSGGIEAVERDISSIFSSHDREHGILPHYLISDGQTNTIATLYTKHYDNVSGIVLLGCMQHLNVSSAMVAAAKSFVMMMGYHSISNALISMTEPPASQGRDEKNKYYWVSSLDDEIQNFIEDPNCGLPLAASAYLELIAAEKLTSKANWAQDFPNIPILIMSGTDDIMGNYSKAAREKAGLLWDTSHDFVSLRIYSGCRHDLLHDCHADNVKEDIINWFVNQIERNN